MLSRKSSVPHISVHGLQRWEGKGRVYWLRLAGVYKCGKGHVWAHT